MLLPNSHLTGMSPRNAAASLALVKLLLLKMAAMRFAVFLPTAGIVRSRIVL